MEILHDCKVCGNKTAKSYKIFELNEDTIIVKCSCSKGKEDGCGSLFNLHYKKTKN